MTAKNYLTYLHLLTPLHTGGSADEGNLMGIAREVHTEFPYLPSSSLRGKIRAELEQGETKDAAGHFFGQKIKDGNQPTEGEVWFADATLLLFPIASLSHHIIWITCPLWLDRWSRWLGDNTQDLQALIRKCSDQLTNSESNKSAVTSFPTKKLYLQTALLDETDIFYETDWQALQTKLESIIENSGLLGNLFNKLIVLTDEDCAALVELGLQREVRVALEEESKTVKGGSFRSEEAIPPEAIMFFPWGTKVPRPLPVDLKEPDEEKRKKAASEAQEKVKQDETIRQTLHQKLNGRLQFGGLEGLGRGWTNLKTVPQIQGEKK